MCTPSSEFILVFVKNNNQMSSKNVWTYFEKEILLYLQLDGDFCLSYPPRRPFATRLTKNVVGLSIALLPHQTSHWVVPGSELGCLLISPHRYWPISRGALAKIFSLSPDFIFLTE